MAIIYDPSKTIKDIAKEAKVPVTTVRSFLQRNGYHYMEDRADYLKKAIFLYLKKNPEASVKEIANKYGISTNTVRKYKSLNKLQNDRKSEVNAKKKKLTGLSIENSDSAILKTILKLYFPLSKTFDCDLTFGQGGFYKTGINPPEFIYDKYLFGEKSPDGYVVKSLDETKNINSSSFESVVLDLPVNIDPTVHDYNAFKSLDEKYDTYHKMIDLSNKLLIPGGILVFKTSDFVLRNDDTISYVNEWATDNVIAYSLDHGYDLVDRFISVRNNGIIVSGSHKLSAGSKHAYFLVFKKK